MFSEEAVSRKAQFAEIISTERMLQTSRGARRAVRGGGGLAYSTAFLQVRVHFPAASILASVQQELPTEYPGLSSKIANLAIFIYNIAKLASIRGVDVSSATIAQTRDGFSGIVQRIVSGETTEHYVMNRNRPVAKIVPVEQERDVSRRIGVMRGKWADFDYEEFQELDSEIAESMGV